MKTKEEIIEGLKHCSQDVIPIHCIGCPYSSEPRCVLKLKKDALELIQSLLYPDMIPDSWKESVMQSFVKGE